MKTLAAILLALATFPAHAGEKWVGEWEDGSISSIELLAEIPFIVRYCHQHQCENYEPNGEASHIIFTFEAGENFPGAKMELKREGDVYRGWYKQTGADRDYKITMGRE